MEEELCQEEGEVLLPENLHTGLYHWVAQQQGVAWWGKVVMVRRETRLAVVFMEQWSRRQHM